MEVVTVAPTRTTSGTYNDYLEAVAHHPELRVEYFNGEILMAPAPRPIHQLIADNLNWLLNQHVRGKRLGRILQAPLDVELAPEAFIVQPDLIFIRQERLDPLLGETRILGAPDLVVEILSPSTAGHDRIEKLPAYARHGVAEYWIVDAEQEAVEVYTLDGDTYRVAGIFQVGSIISVGQFAAAQIAIADIFDV